MYVFLYRGWIVGAEEWNQSGALKLLNLAFQIIVDVALFKAAGQICFSHVLSF